jgi:hypothetical protein
MKSSLLRARAQRCSRSMPLWQVAAAMCCQAPLHQVALR